MAKEMKVIEMIRKAGYEPREGNTIIVKYAPKNMSEQIVQFFSTEFYILQICKDFVVLMPIINLSWGRKKEVALEIPIEDILNVTVTEEYLNYRIRLETKNGTIDLSAQQKELSEFRSSGTLATGIGALNVGIMGSKSLEKINWHRNNLDQTLEALKTVYA
ncbi:hypothetical protein C823_005094 [Eubacterium plexicaudatum ASF492]|uniref:Uncharacterized protein n=1 Tax=Eubacterium plexicaudatum ASF492 TaxID=1235802 RepID=N1ZT44_9FIRM|nr:hypothetical protein C823_005094 [Eubacterium plexicaudatum ASF492]